MNPMQPIDNLPPDVVLSVYGVSKKFCRNLKRSMWYGMQDLARNMLGIRSKRKGINLKPLNVGQVETNDSQSATPPLRRDEFWAVRDVSFDLKKGESLGVIGVNGSEIGRAHV